MLGWRRWTGFGAVREPDLEVPEEAGRRLGERLALAFWPAPDFLRAVELLLRVGVLVAMGARLPADAPGPPGLRACRVTCRDQVSTTTGTIIGRRRWVELTQRPTWRRTTCSSA